MSRFASFLFFFLTRFISVQLQIEEISRKLRTGELGIAPVEERFDPIKHTNSHSHTQSYRSNVPICDRVGASVIKSPIRNKNKNKKKETNQK